MKTTLKLLALIAIASLITAGKPSEVPWVLTKWLSNGAWQPNNAFGSGGDEATFTFPDYTLRDSAVFYSAGLGGGDFWDVGIGVLSGTGTANFHLNAFSAQ